MELSLGTVISLASNLAGGRNDIQPSEASLLANLALERVVMMAGTHHKPREAIAISSSTSGGNRIALPTDFDTPLAFTLYQGSTSTATTSRTTDAVPLIQRDAAWIDAQPNQFYGGVPSNYIWYATWLELYPSPNSAYSLQLRYRTKQPVLSLSTATPALDAVWGQAWLYATAEQFAAARADASNEALNRNRLQNYVTMIETDLAKAQQDRRSQTLRPGMVSNLRGGRGRAS